MASNNFTYNYGTLLFANSSLNILADNVAMLLVTPDYFLSGTIESLADANTVADIASYELTAASVAGYQRLPLASKLMVRVPDGSVSNGYVYLQAANLNFTALGVGNTVGGAVLIKDTGDNATSPLLGFYYIPPTLTNGGDIGLNWANNTSGGALKIT